jgi:hypothetical protein
MMRWYVPAYDFLSQVVDYDEVDFEDRIGEPFGKVLGALLSDGSGRDHRARDQHQWCEREWNAADRSHVEPCCRERRGPWKAHFAL